MIRMTRRAYSTMLCRVIRRQRWASFRFSGNRQMCGNLVLVFEVWQLLCIQLARKWNSWRFRHNNERMQEESLRTSIFDQNNWQPKPKLRVTKMRKMTKNWKFRYFSESIPYKILKVPGHQKHQKMIKIHARHLKISPKLKIWDITKFSPKPHQNHKNDD